MKNNYKLLIIILLIVFIVPQIAMASWWNPMSWGWLNRIFHFQKTNQQNQVACTMEAKLCPDGSSVGREGPKCEFKACPETKLISDVYPLFESESLKWSNAGPSPRQTMPGYEISATAKITDNSKARNFFNYYDKKLKDLGWTVDNNSAADGILGSQVGYKKDNNYIILSYNITPGKVISGQNEPMRWTCPCGVVYTIFTSQANTNSETLYWFDNTAKHPCLAARQFYGEYMYYGLQTFKTQDECLNKWSLDHGRGKLSVKLKACLLSGGNASSVDCYCSGTKDFYNNCAVGACTCTPNPANRRLIQGCDCGEGKCWDGEVCKLVK